MFINIKNKKAFTLIEIMIAVGVLAVLSGATLSVINGPMLQRRARDSQRIADLKRIETAIGLYYADKRQMPDFSVGTNWYNTENGAFTSALAPFISSVPQDPVTNYWYRRNSSDSFDVAAGLEDSQTLSKCDFTTGCQAGVTNCCRFRHP